MKKQFSLTSVILIVLCAVFLTFQITLLTVQLSYDKKYNDVMNDLAFYQPLFEVADAYEQYYLREMDADMLRQYMIYGYITGANDRYAGYYTAEEFEQVLQEADGKSVDIGVSAMWDAETSSVLILLVFPNSPAATAGLLPGDRVTAANGTQFSQVGEVAALDAISGDVGTSVTLSVQRGNATLPDITVTRAEVETTTVFARTLASGIGFVRITQFDNTTPIDLKEVLDGFVSAGTKKVIFDLRDNPGGLVDAVAKSLDMLLPAGTIVTTTNKDGVETEKLTSDADCYDFEMAVLVNENSASAAELFSCALQDYAKQENATVKAKLFGTVTYGKGTIQESYQLPSGAVLQLTTHYYNPPFSANYDGVGVTPDQIERLPAAAQNTHSWLLSEAADTQLAAAVVYLETK